ncbi:MAG: hypothetical protein D6776_10465 [Planctomycetota bacterium]|nr:MAG: hypothetical protein D6776_10465 [Planctomycetota bacterium]
METTANPWTPIAIPRTNVSATEQRHDGVLHGASVGSRIDSNLDLPTATGWTIGDRASFRFTGSIDELRFSDRVLAPSSFLHASIVVPEPGPAAALALLGAAALLRMRRARPRG